MAEPWNNRPAYQGGSAPPEVVKVLEPEGAFNRAANGRFWTPLPWTIVGYPSPLRPWSNDYFLLVRSDPDDATAEAGPLTAADIETLDEIGFEALRQFAVSGDIEQLNLAIGCLLTVLRQPLSVEQMAQ